MWGGGEPWVGGGSGAGQLVGVGYWRRACLPALCLHPALPVHSVPAVISDYVRKTMQVPFPLHSPTLILPTTPSLAAVISDYVPKAVQVPVRGGVVALSVLTALGLTKLAISGAQGFQDTAGCLVAVWVVGLSMLTPWASSWPSAVRRGACGPGT